MEYPGNVAIESYLKDKNLYDKVDQAKLAKGLAVPNTVPYVQSQCGKQRLK